ncbi:uncharacterized protein HRG_02352 [Hirsutella rhossiliensis]|uniref:Uncharacterized protein n=1 Tax=Hirsutella rhossiliensis TaxID=111463 RepID=A0A9P8N3E7_9HYPO|nr:uncharacterized protein HRG_02352 [Hirsutella rhossiliensis]KAH0966943.1 hypothetical protein HRG_02352 [Hirsutella rhossiliensis]
MRHTTVSMPAIRVASKLEDLELVVQASLLLGLPESRGRLTSSDELLDLVTTKHLWICRAGSCHFNVTILVEGEPIAGIDEEARLAEWVGECEVWDRLGLRLQYCGSTSRTGSPGEMIFSIQHPDLSSALIAPQGALSADFRSSSCRIDISTTRASRASKGRRRKRQRTEDGLARTETLPSVTAPDEGDFYHGLTYADRKAVEAFVLSMDFEASSQQDKQRAEQEDTNSARLVESLIGSSRARDLVQVAIRVLVCGQKGQHKEFMILRSSPLHSLATLAPAVFHVPYLKTVSDRAKLLPIIATSLARMTSAESPSLRQAVESLGESTQVSVAREDTQTTHIPRDQVVAGIERRA